MPRYYRKVIRITAEDSPNVRLALAQKAAGLKPTGEIIVPGVLSYDEYLKRLATYDDIQKSVSLWAKFWEGAELRLFPVEWLNRAHRIAEQLRGARREGEAIGVDPGEGGANTAWSVIDRMGVLELVAMKTPDTSVIPEVTLHLMHKWGVPADRVAFDRGGGGLQIADQLRKEYPDIRTVAFGEGVTPELQLGFRELGERKRRVEEHYVYVNRRAQMYGELSSALDPHYNEDGFGIPREYAAYRNQLEPLPKRYDKEGRLKLPPKNKTGVTSKEQTLIDLLGCSPDEADSLVLAYHALTHEASSVAAGAIRI